MLPENFSEPEKEIWRLAEAARDKRAAAEEAKASATAKQKGSQRRILAAGAHAATAGSRRVLAQLTPIPACTMGATGGLAVSVQETGIGGRGMIGTRAGTACNAARLSRKTRKWRKGKNRMTTKMKTRKRTRVQGKNTCLRRLARACSCTACREQRTSMGARRTLSVLTLKVAGDLWSLS